jgi:hypothetical protein
MLRQKTTDEVHQGGKGGLDMQDGRKKPQTEVVKNFLEATRVDEKVGYGRPMVMLLSYRYDDL